MATYAFPLNGHTGLEGHGDVWSHKRNMAEQSLWESKVHNSAYPIGVKSPFKSPTHTHVHGHHQPSRSMPSNTMQDARQVNQHHCRNNSTLSSLEERGTIDRRHGKPIAPLNLKSSNYAFPAPASSVEQRIRSDSSASGTARWVIDLCSNYQRELTGLVDKCPQCSKSWLQYSYRFHISVYPSSKMNTFGRVRKLRVKIQ